MESFDQEIAYEAAQKRVKKLKGFYIHLLVYIVVNVMIVYVNYTYSKTTTSLFELKNYTTAFWWGIGLMAHGFNVFFIDLIFDKDWEERKIRELMNKEKEYNDFV
ncbi:MAG: 2TM domain-containing protein [Saprospiraceae bacterium]|nr:2TM domain-containing protein [Saprospiraceae bacterium]